MADNIHKHNEVNSADVYLNGIAEYIRVLQDMKKLSPQVAIGADDLIRTLKQLEKDFMIVKFPEKGLDSGEAVNGGQPLDDDNKEE